MSIEPIEPPASPIAEATRPSTSGPRSSSTRRISENCALGAAMGEEGGRGGAGRGWEHIKRLLRAGKHEGQDGRRAGGQDGGRAERQTAGVTGDSGAAS